MKQKQTTVGSVYPGYLHAGDLAGPLRLTIVRADVRTLPKPGGFYERCCVLIFAEDPRCLALNKTQASALAEIAGSDAFAEWPGVEVVLGRGESRNHRPTITVGAAA